ncbi:MAG: tyrosine-type recombinase/integrase [Bacteroidia bacterium]
MWKEKHKQTIEYRLENYVLVKIGDLPILNVTPQILLSCLEEIEKASHDIVRRIVQNLSRTFKFAHTTGRAKEDPTVALIEVMAKPTNGHFKAIKVAELSDFLKALHENEAKSSRQLNLANKLMLLTALRTSELLGAQWKEIDFDNKLWTIPANRMKMKREHLVPLSTQSIEILLELKEVY